jgi:hypothetical protein
VPRVRYADEARTWLHLDPARGAIVQKMDDTRRLRRWLYQGLHSLGFPRLRSCAGVAAAAEAGE